jgi:MFS family permease
MKKAITKYLEKAPPLLFVIYAILTAFVTYSCMYAFRKPFTAATFTGQEFWGVDYKILLIISQVIGYMLSKFIGIKLVSEMGKDRRSVGIIVLIMIAWLALLLFAVVPAPYNIFLMFFNGLPLGMVWGLVFSYLEGRRFTEVLGAGLSISFIFSSGLVKTVGAQIMLWGASEFWMPFLTGAFFVIPLIIFVFLLDRLPEPNAIDEKMRTRRLPMKASERRRFFLDFAPGLILLIISYMLLTAFRDFRDNFAAEIWKAVGYGDSPEIFTLTEIPVSLAVLGILGMLFIIKNNFKALIISHGIILFGFLLTGFATLFYANGMISAPLWMILTGGGLYFGYVPFNSMFFDRLIAAFKKVSNVGFLIYLADSFGYMGSVGVLLFKNFGRAEMSWQQFFISSSYYVSIIGGLLVIASVFYFWVKFKKQDEITVESKPALETK